MTTNPEFIPLPQIPPGRPYLIGLSGGTGSGKTTIAQTLLEQIGARQVALISHDAYYRHRPHLSFEERTRVNYDHPNSLETDLLLRHLGDLLQGRTIEQPVYDFSQHLRSQQTIIVEPRPVILVEGILILVEPELREVLNLKVFVDTDPDIRVLRRVERDVRDRGRSFKSVVRQYHETVRPMHLQFVEPAKRHADIIIPEGYNQEAVGALITMVREVIRRYPQDQPQPPD